ncbi:hypothetical protein MAR_016656 [Mya arenaria]|uniref:Uncharacterized protein n=1 Tax=Mya arenaria TaxID=6604 RepID=A0ABY7EDA8_MYAAR|nr:hypothetical protein MAR_016656 [Mya arenaria]
MPQTLVASKQRVYFTDIGGQLPAASSILTGTPDNDFLDLRETKSKKNNSVNKDSDQT